MFEEYNELAQLSRLALAGRRQDIQVFIRRLARRLQSSKPEISEKLDRLLAESPTRDSPLRSEAMEAIPTDSDSRLRLARIESPVFLDTEPIWTDHIRQKMERLIAERSRQSELVKAGLLPTRSLLLTGSPGVGKSLTARWIARQLNCPLIMLDLSAVMSSFLGKTGVNVRHVLDYAKSMECVLLLDELDAVAKRRDDETEIGELKRLVTVLLQEIDDWPPTGLLVAATNHPALLDPAVWRRFDMLVEFPMPTDEQVRQAVEKSLANRVSDQALLELLAISLRGLSFSDIDRELRKIMRQAVISDSPIRDALFDCFRERVTGFTLEERKVFAKQLSNAGFTQREIHEWTHLHRDTLRKIGVKPNQSPAD